MRQIRKRTYHGGSNTRIYNVYRNMMERCFNSDCKDYEHYGQRGITVDPSLRSFADYRDWFQSAFNETDLPEGLTIDRINNDGNYEPNNLKLATQQQQQNNKRSNKLITFNSQTKTIAEWARETGIPRKTLEKRLGKYNWPVDKALTMPAKEHWQWIKYKGEKKTINEWAEHLNIPKSTIRFRLKKGFPLNQVFAD